ncbi:Pimeloyl-ACP methyl ester carboxylesterase [Hymenobacter gelipurpurascens]|uniref:Pimeloyl-ACP methyl ester carboxylesterase n=1 Tax=Hymenobacter gelipurpurascens TaxID=89968 RepID=A0A212UED9_9BACT|nr:alpha/beta hydrolase [Hymenobacter gelipurpurascens]SNC76615.1 Pimeloyl-ACP methyl ester carboxylesterase [Hymenobacter gelipurpurascens]
MMYLIPGLGADERVFQNLQPLLQGETQVLQWLTPEPDETLPQYAARMAARIPLGQSGLLVGVSFGGMVALEITRMRPEMRTVLISSIPDSSCLPPLLRLIRATGVYRLVPPQMLKLFPRAGQWYFGVKQKEYPLFKEILRDMEPVYTKWAIDRLMHWDSTIAGRSTQILGTHDRVFPPGPTPVEHLIRGGGHFMVISHAPEIAQILNKLAAEQTNRAATSQQNAV